MVLDQHFQGQKCAPEQRHSDNHLLRQKSETDHTVEYTVKGKDDDGEKQEYQIKVPSQVDLDIEPDHETKPGTETGNEGQLDVRPEVERRISKPPRIGSGIIPTLTPLIADEDIGMAR